MTNKDIITIFKLLAGALDELDYTLKDSGIDSLENTGYYNYLISTLRGKIEDLEINEPDFNRELKNSES